MFAIMLGCSGSAFIWFDIDALAFTVSIRALTGARRGVVGGDEISESTASWAAGCLALGITRLEVGGQVSFCLFLTCFKLNVAGVSYYNLSL